MSDQATAASSTPEPQRATGSLKAGTGELKAAAAAVPVEDAAPSTPPARRDLSVRIAETVIYLFAVVGAVAIGLGISNYLGKHPYVYLYLIAYAAFRIADLLVREESMLGTDRAHFARRIMGELPVLALFAIAPFERSYFSGEPPDWLAGLGLLIELLGLWLALGARIQLGFFSSGKETTAPRPLVRNGLYRFIRHPIYAGEFLVLFAWPFEYGAPLTMLAMVVTGIFILRRRIQEDEAEMLANYGDEYSAYIRATDALIPNVW
ncbi:MAG TPA: isoprenylcysteine carboxylmethyltransferase family protein [Candidatus Binataceae bacterium]|jgi:protein-S-isoprenylcysteine O-methyltransferase Ste14|nr:isoprenylcysteine carboxylmethyltransferase family protein [Candidatus Binataceae bacterium]